MLKKKNLFAVLAVLLLAAGCGRQQEQLPANDSGTVETFAYNELLLEVSNVREIKQATSFDGMERWEYDVYVVDSGAEMKVLHPDTFVDEERGLEHANWAVYTSDDTRIDIEKGMEPVEITSDILGVYDPESSLYVLGFEMSDHQG